MLDELFVDLKHEIKMGYLKKRHPFRWVTLATTDEQTGTRMRTVVLRDCREELNLLFYTDGRSTKIDQIKRDPRASVLLYHPKKLLQLTVYGKLLLHTSGPDYENRWAGIPEKSRKDYITERPPGSPIANPDEVDYQNKHHFTLMELVPERVDYLRLKRPNHLRATFERVEGDWQGQWLVP
ncbi:pyridoxamine 5'-phosphate oxidase family protein [Croceiramulus getboli]|nr:pyridoxamine 5'-phosphate oxidase family protein [Flavobacteriaceae bacterium YJPT1-3]